MKTKKVFLVSFPDETGRRILARAKEMFVRSGFVHVTTGEISESLGISKATLYKYYPTKEDLLRAVIRSILGDVLAGVEAIVRNEDRDFVGKLVDLIGHMSSALPKLGTFLARDLQKAAPEIWREVDAFRREKIYRNLKILLRAGIAEGDIKRTIEPDLLVIMFVSLVEGLLTPEALVRHSWRASDIFAAIVSVFFEGIMTEKAKKKYQAQRLVPRRGELSCAGRLS